MPQDVNGEEDVYEYEAEGEGNCRNSTATFNERVGGCVGLISSGTSSEESAFLDASVSGNDVFFLTASQLVQSDLDTALDVYDAHVCVLKVWRVQPRRSPHHPVPQLTHAERPPRCSRRIFGAPASATFSGPGILY